jgi:hypothetical protein
MAFNQIHESTSILSNTLRHESTPSFKQVIARRDSTIPCLNSSYSLCKNPPEIESWSELRRPVIDGKGLNPTAAQEE